MKQPPCAPDGCIRPSLGAVCTSGQLTDYCDYASCTDEYCDDVGHCTCPCHAGCICKCGFVFATGVESVVYSASTTALQTTNPRKPWAGAGGTSESESP